MLPSGTFVEKYEQDKAIFRTRFQWVAFITFIVLLFCVPFFITTEWVEFITLTGITVIAVLGLQILTGYTGQINLGNSAFMGVGAFIGCLTSVKFGLSVEPALIVGGLAASIFGLIFAIPAGRVKGFYLALTTLAAQFIFYFIFSHIPGDWLTGITGVLDVGVPRLLTGTELTSVSSKYYLVLICVIIFTFFTVNILRSKIGRAFMAIKDNDIAAEVLGVNVFLYKILAFVICAFFSGVAGVLWGYYFRTVSVEHFSLFQSIWMLGMIIVGGLGSTLGAILGTFSIRLLVELTVIIGPNIDSLARSLGASGSIGFAFTNFLIGAMIIVFLVFEPRGLAHRWKLLLRFIRIWPFPYW